MTRGVPASAFVGAAYDPHDERVELMLGTDPTRARRIPHGIADVQAIALGSRHDGAGNRGRDDVLVVQDAAGHRVLTFPDTRGSTGS